MRKLHVSNSATGRTVSSTSRIDELVPADGLSSVLDGDLLRAAFASYPSGVTAICGLRQGVPTGMIASSFTSVSLDPPLVSFCVAHTSTTWPKLREGGEIGISILSTEHRQIGRQLASKRTDRFEDVAWDSTSEGAVLVHGSALWIAGTVEQEVTAGDHDIVVVRIRSLSTRQTVAPLVFHGSRFTELALS